MTLDIYSDLACPWCYVAERRLDTVLAEEGMDDVEVVFHPFQLDPGASFEARPLLQRLDEKFGGQAEARVAQVTAAAAAEGVEMDWRRALEVNTLHAHRLMQFALREGGPAAQRTLAALLFDAHFSRGGDLADHDTLADLAGRAGLDRSAAAEYLASDAGTDEVQDGLRRAHELGINAVPTIIYDGRYATQGAQPKATLRRAIEQVRVHRMERAE